MTWRNPSAPSILSDYQTQYIADEAHFKEVIAWVPKVNR